MLEEWGDGTFVPKTCPECARLERENAALRLEMKALAEHQVELMDALEAMKNSTHAMRRAQ
jgi:hypothetical protein